MTNRYAKFQKSTNYVVDTWPADSANNHEIDIISDDISGDKGFIYPETSAQRLKRNRLEGGIVYTGEIQIPAYPREAMSMLYYALGSLTSAMPDASGVIKHTVKMATTIPNFNLAIGRDKMEHRYTGGCLKGLTIDYEVNEPVLLTCDTMFRTELASGALDTITFPDYNVLEKAFAGAQVEHKINNTTVHYIESASVEIANSIVEDNFTLGSRYLPNKFVEGLEVTGNFEIAYSDYQRYADFLNEQELKLQLIASYGGAATAREFELSLPNLSLNTANLPTDSTSRYLLETEFMAQRDSTNNAVYAYISNTRTNAQMVG